MNSILTSVHNEVPWVLHLDSWTQWPVFWVSSCVHWWEVTWIRIIEEFLKSNKEWRIKLIKWSLMLILANVDAYKSFIDVTSSLDNTMTKEKLEAVKKYRYLDENMNRCTAEDNLNVSISREVKRVNELSKTLENIDILLDIHTTSTPSDSIMIYSSWMGREKYSDICNTKEHLIDITDHLAWKPFFDMVERSGGVWLAIESWYELDDQWYKVWFENLIRLLDEEWMIEVEWWVDQFYSPRKENRKIQIYDHIVFRNNDFSSIYLKDKPLHHGQILPEGTYMWFDWLADIFLSEVSIIIMPNVGVKYIWEEFCFLWRLV